MPWGLFYEIVKDVADLVRMKEIDPIDPGTTDLSGLVSQKILEGQPNDYRWTAPRLIFKFTEGQNVTHNIVWLTDHKRRTKRKIIRYSYDGNIDLILTRKVSPEK